MGCISTDHRLSRDILRPKRLFKFIGGPSAVEDVASNIFTIQSGKQFKGTFQIIDEPSGNKILKIEYENLTKVLGLFHGMGSPMSLIVEIR